MKTLFKKMDQQAERWLNAWDEKLQQPLVNTMTGEVFTHDTNGQHTQPFVEQTTDQTNERAAHPMRGTRPTNPVTSTQQMLRSADC